ncbi:protein kinase domain-containing protein [Nocardia fluminea]|uniref:protein kinase domain-containing protein n=1 Tax=Nocardia fluminea TaxID=134984 RepID=UPI00365761B6
MLKVFEQGVDHGVHYTVMEYCRFGSLESYLSGSGGSTHKQAVDILTQVAGALTSLSERQPIFLGLSPRNILVRNVAPLDLVLSDSAGEPPIAYSSPGALVVRAPANDWWSLGMVLYRVLIGHAYFQLDDGAWLSDQTIHRALATEDVSLELIDSIALVPAQRARWKVLLAGLLTRDPARRWAMSEVDAWLDEERQVVQEGTETRSSLPSRRGHAVQTREPCLLDDFEVEQWVTAEHRGVVGDLSETLDIETGLREVLVPASHADIVSDLRETLDVEGGLAAIIDDPVLDDWPLAD